MNNAASASPLVLSVAVARAAVRVRGGRVAGWEQRVFINSFGVARDGPSRPRRLQRHEGRRAGERCSGYYSSSSRHGCAAGFTRSKRAWMAVLAARAATSCLGRGAAVPYSAARCTTTRASSECNRASTAPRAMRVGALEARFWKWLLRALRTSSGHVLGLRQAPRSLLLSPASSPARFFFYLLTRRREGFGLFRTRPGCSRGLGR